jgi:hypothetical protein
MENYEGRLTLDRLSTYQIKVPGVFDKEWLSLDEEVTVRLESNGDGQPNTVIACIVDQAALHGLLSRLYNHGLPLLSVIWMEPD